MITPYDPFGYGYMMYTVRNQCMEVPDMPYEDGLQYIYFNTNGTKGGSPAIRAMLNYIQNSREENAVTETLRKIHHCVDHVRVLPEVREGYMTLGEYLDYHVKEGIKEGLQEIKEEMLQKERDQQQVQSILVLLEDYGQPSQELLNCLQDQADQELWKKALKLAAKAESMDAFENGLRGMLKEAFEAKVAAETKENLE